MANQPFRITYRLEVIIEAESFKEANEIFMNSDLKKLNKKADFVELVSCEDEENRSEHEV